MVRLIVSDIDGTLVPDGGGPEAINPEYFNAVKELIKKDIVVVLASGRQYSSMRRMFRPVSSDLIYISEGGTMVFEQGEVIHATPLPQELCREIITDIETIPECDAMVCGKKKVYVRSKDSQLYHWMKESYRYDIEAVGDGILSVNDDVVKISLFHRYDKAEEAGSGWFIPKWNHKLKVSLAGVQWIDLVPKGTGKGSCLAFIQERYGIGKEETVVFGDNFNDIDMFLEAKTSYAVSNARPEVKEQASHICEGYRKDGVLAEWRKIING